MEEAYQAVVNRNIKEDIKDYTYSHIFVVANIPYYITTPIVEKIINSGVDVEKVVIMVQKEVGDRFSAKPGSKEYGSISVFLNYYYIIKELFIVSKNCFTPKPNVDSVILSLEKRQDKLQVKDEKLLFKLIKLERQRLRQRSRRGHHGGSVRQPAVQRHHPQCRWICQHAGLPDAQ